MVGWEMGWGTPEALWNDDFEARERAVLQEIKGRLSVMGS